jgi:hypothetical protein
MSVHKELPVALAPSTPHAVEPPQAGLPLSQQMIERNDTHQQCTKNEKDDANIHQKEATEVPPNGGYGWVCVVCVSSSRLKLAEI